MSMSGDACNQDWYSTEDHSRRSRTGAAKCYVSGSKQTLARWLYFIAGVFHLRCRQGVCILFVPGYTTPRIQPPFIPPLSGPGCVDVATRCLLLFVMAYRQPNPEDTRRERHAEKLRRSFEALGREQNSIFEYLAEYTHEVQAEVRALQIARDRLNAERLPSSGQGGASSASSPMTPVRLGRPMVLGDRWVSFEAAAAGVFSCGLLGFTAGVLGWGWRQGKVVRVAARRKDRNRQRRLHED